MANIKDPLYADFHLPSGTLWARWNFCEDFENPSNTWNNKQSYILPASLCKLSDLDEDENGVSKYNKHKDFYRKVYTASIEIPSHKIEVNNQSTSLYNDGIIYVNINLLDEFGDDIWDKSTDEVVDLLFNYIYDHNSSAQLLIDIGKYIPTYINDITSDEGFMYAAIDSSPEPNNTEVNNLFRNQPKLSSYHILNIPNYDDSFGRYTLTDSQQEWYDDTTRRFDMFVKDNLNHWKPYIKKCLKENKVAPLIGINKEYERKVTFNYFKDTYNGIEVFKTLYKNKGLQAGTQWDIVTNEYGGWRMPTDKEWNELYIYTKQREIHIPSSNWTASTVYVSGVEFYNDYDSIIIPHVNEVHNSKLNINDKSLKNLNKLHKYGYYDYEKFYAMQSLSIFEELNHLSPNVVGKKWTWRWPFDVDKGYVRGVEFGYGCINSDNYHLLKFNNLTLADENTARTISWDKAKDLYDDYFENTIFPDFNNTKYNYNRFDHCWFGNGWAALTPYQVESEFIENKYSIHSLLDINKHSVYINEHITELSETTQRDSIIDLVNEHDTSIVYTGLANSWKYDDESKQQGKENLYVNQLSNIELPSTERGDSYITTNSYGNIIAPFLTPIRPVKNTDVYKLSNGPESSEKYDAYIKHSLDYTVDEVKKEHLNTIKFVDLGLTSGTLWATENIGSTSLSSYGKVYYFGQEDDDDDLSKFDDMKSSDAIELFQNAFKNVRYYESGKEYGNIQKTKYDLVYKLYNKFYGSTDIVTPTWSQWNELLTECTLKVFPHEAMIKYLGSNEYTDIELGGYTIMCTSKKYPDRYILLQLGGNAYQGSWYPVINTSKSTADGFSQYLTSSVLKPFKQDENYNYVYSNELFNDYAKYIGDESYSLPTANGLDIEQYFGVGVVINNDFTRHYYSPEDDAILADSLLSFEPLITSGYLLDGKTYGTYHGNTGYMIFGKLRPVCLPNGILPEIEEDTPGGTEPGGTEPGGDTPGGTEPGGTEPGGTEPGGDTPGGDTSGGDDTPTGGGDDNSGGSNNSGSNIDTLPYTEISTSSSVTNNITYEVSNPINEIKINVDYSNIPQPKEETEADKKKKFIRDTARALYAREEDLSHPKINATKCYENAIVLANVIFNDPDEKGKLNYYTNEEVDNLVNKIISGELKLTTVYTKNELDVEIANLQNSINSKSSESTSEISKLKNDLANANNQLTSMKQSLESEINLLKGKINELISVINSGGGSVTPSDGGGTTPSDGGGTTPGGGGDDTPSGGGEDDNEPEIEIPIIKEAVFSIIDSISRIEESASSMKWYKIRNKCCARDKNNNGGKTEWTGELVDLGIPSGVKWGDRNLSATSEEDTRTETMFGWGITIPNALHRDLTESPFGYHVEPDNMQMIDFLTNGHITWRLREDRTEQQRCQYEPFAKDNYNNASYSVNYEGNGNWAPNVPYWLNNEACCPEFTDNTDNLAKINDLYNYGVNKEWGFLPDTTEDQFNNSEHTITIESIKEKIRSIHPDWDEESNEFKDAVKQERKKHGPDIWGKTMYDHWIERAIRPIEDKREFGTATGFSGIGTSQYDAATVSDKNLRTPSYLDWVELFYYTYVEPHVEYDADELVFSKEEIINELKENTTDQYEEVTYKYYEDNGPKNVWLQFNKRRLNNQSDDPKVNIKIYMKPTPGGYRYDFLAPTYPTWKIGDGDKSQGGEHEYMFVFETNIIEWHGDDILHKRHELMLNSDLRDIYIEKAQLYGENVETDEDVFNFYKKHINFFNLYYSDQADITSISKTIKVKQIKNGIEKTFNVPHSGMTITLGGGDSIVSPKIVNIYDKEDPRLAAILRENPDYEYGLIVSSRLDFNVSVAGASRGMGQYNPGLNNLWYFNKPISNKEITLTTGDVITFEGVTIEDLRKARDPYFEGSEKPLYDNEENYYNIYVNENYGHFGADGYFLNEYLYNIDSTAIIDYLNDHTYDSYNVNICERWKYNYEVLLPMQISYIENMLKTYVNDNIDIYNITDKNKSIFTDVWTNPNGICPYGLLPPLQGNANLINTYTYAFGDIKKSPYGFSGYYKHKAYVGGILNNNAFVRPVSNEITETINGIEEYKFEFGKNIAHGRDYWTYKGSTTGYNATGYVDFNIELPSTDPKIKKKLIWAKYNIGAEHIYDHGYCFIAGNPDPITAKNFTSIKPLDTFINAPFLTTEYDPATKFLAGHEDENGESYPGWQVPTEDQWNLLLSNVKHCSKTYHINVYNEKFDSTVNIANSNPDNATIQKNEEYKTVEIKGIEFFDESDDSKYLFIPIYEWCPVYMSKSFKEGITQDNMKEICKVFNANTCTDSTIAINSNDHMVYVGNIQKRGIYEVHDEGSNPAHPVNNYPFAFVRPVFIKEEKIADEESNESNEDEETPEDGE